MTLPRMRSLRALFSLSLLAVNSLFSSAQAADKPNFVFFLIDDLGRQDLGCYGSTFHETPNVDQLAREGVQFMDAYSAAPLCSPTRASILTGKYPVRVGITRATPEQSLSLDELTIAEALKEAGYRTAHLGKWHLQSKADKSRDHFPEAQGFDVNIGGHTAGQPSSFFYPYKAKHEKYRNNDVPDLEGGEDGEFLTDRLTAEAIQFIKASGEQPFLLNLWYYAVHTPVQGKPEKIAKYTAKAAALGYDPKEQPGLEEHQSVHHARQDNPTYAALVESMDDGVGRILEALDELGLAENTIVIFMSDNGGLSTGKNAKMPTSCLPLRAGKAWNYEGGIRAPLIVKWPGQGGVGVQNSEPVISTDFYPTMLEMAGLPLRPEQHLDGVSFAPLVSSDTDHLDREAIYFHSPHHHHINTMGPSGAMRMGNYKIVEAFRTGKVELYNLEDDLGEQNDLATQMPELAQRMQQMLADWREQTGAIFVQDNYK